MCYVLKEHRMLLLKILKNRNMKIALKIITVILRLIVLIILAIPASILLSSFFIDRDMFCNLWDE
jgi:hypothetical protein